MRNLCFHVVVVFYIHHCPRNISVAKQLFCSFAYYACVPLDQLEIRINCLFGYIIANVYIIVSKSNIRFIHTH